MANLSIIKEPFSSQSYLIGPEPTNQRNDRPAKTFGSKAALGWRASDSGRLSCSSLRGASTPVTSKFRRSDNPPIINHLNYNGSSKRSASTSQDPELGIEQFSSRALGETVNLRRLICHCSRLPESYLLRKSSGCHFEILSALRAILKISNLERASRERSRR